VKEREDVYGSGRGGRRCKTRDAKAAIRTDRQNWESRWHKKGRTRGGCEAEGSREQEIRRSRVGKEDSEVRDSEEQLQGCRKVQEMQSEIADVGRV